MNIKEASVAYSKKKKSVALDVQSNRVLISLATVALIASVLAGFLFYKMNEMEKRLEAQQGVEDSNEVADLVSKVSKIILLPEGELPTVATVSNPEELKNEPFFSKAKTGDKVLLYPKAKRAYLYDPVAHKILEVSLIAPENVPTN